jgi:3-oxoacyl-[acyl-carrier-protein] synthase II
MVVEAARNRGIDQSRLKEIDPTTRVVVTGMGAITPLGIGVEATWQNLIAGKSGIVPHVYEQYPVIKAKVAGMAPEFDPKELLDGLASFSDIRARLHRSAFFSLIASKEALNQAGLLSSRIGEKGDPRKWQINPEIVDPFEVAAIIGTGVGGLDTPVEAQAELDKGKHIPPFSILKTLPERTVAPVEKAFGIKGPVETLVAACATGNKAIEQGIMRIMMGDAKIALVGGTESANVPVGTSMFDVLGALSKKEDPSVTPRPFDEARDGFVMAEGAGVLILERLDVARRRGATILAEVTGYGDKSDAYHDTAPSGEGGRVALRQAIRRSEEKGAKGRTYVNLHGTGTDEGDGKEAVLVDEVYGDTATEITGMSSTKGATGHLLGAAGAAEAIFCVKALNEQVMPPTLHLENPIPETGGRNYVPMEAQKGEFDHAHNNAFGFGGLNAIVAFSRYK